MIIKTLLANTATRLNSAEAAIEAQLLLQHVLNVNRAWLIAYENDALQANIHAALEALLKRRLNGEPIAYILGYREFYGLNLKVSPATLIPRADTETLVEAALAKIAPSPQPLSHKWARGLNSQLESPLPLRERVRERGESNLGESNLESPMDSRFRGNDEKSEISDNNQQLSILDLGTGTGAIALAIAKHRPHAHVTALDASQAALNIAIENAQNLNIPNVKFILSDWFSALKLNGHNEKFDVIVSNPPYIEADDAHLKQGDLRFEPVSALASGADGLDAIRIIITQAPQHLNPHGYLLLEHGYNQAESVASLLKQAGFSDISHAKDLAGINRVMIGRV